MSPTASVVPSVEKNSEAKNTNRYGAAPSFSAPARLTWPATGRRLWGSASGAAGRCVTDSTAPSMVAPAIAHSSAPGTRRACRKTASASPPRATRGSGRVKSASAKAWLRASTATIPALRNPSTAMKMPIEAPSPSLICFGMIRVTSSRAPRTVSSRNAMPERHAMPRPVCHGTPLRVSVTPTSTEPPIPGPTRNGRLAYRAMAAVATANSRMVALVTALRSMPPSASSEGMTTSR